MGDYYQSIVGDYLRADRSVFVNPECYIQLKPGKQPPKGSSWYCDALAVDFGSDHSEPATIFLCEVTYSSSLQALIKRLKEWNDNWSDIRIALARDSNLPADWTARVWLYVPKDQLRKLVDGLEKIGNGFLQRLSPRITTLEMAQPWKYNNYNRVNEDFELKRLDGVPRSFWGCRPTARPGADSP